MTVAIVVPLDLSKDRTGRFGILGRKLPGILSTSASASRKKRAGHRKKILTNAPFRQITRNDAERLV